MTKRRFSRVENNVFQYNLLSCIVLLWISFTRYRLLLLLTAYTEHPSMSISVFALTTRVPSKSTSSTVRVHYPGSTGFFQNNTTK